MAEEMTDATPDLTSSAPEVPEAAATPSEPKTPDAMQPFIDTAYETSQHQVESAELDKFLRAHIKTFREDWENWSNSAKSAYTHMMTAQLLQRKAAAIQIGLGHVFKLPDPSAQTNLLASLQRTQTKPSKRYPAIDLPPKLRSPIS